MKLQNKKRAYCFMVSNEARDFYLLIPFIYYLEKFENFEVSFEFVWNAHLIRKQRPDLVILPNSRGNNLYFEIAKYCSENDILVFNHDSEGNFNSKMDYDFWGFNLDRKNFCPVQFTWNDRVKNFLITKYNLPEENIKTSGAPGFDKYKYLSPINKKDILNKYNLGHFTKVIGYAGWAFGKLYNKELSDVLINLSMQEEEGKHWLETQRDLVEQCLRSAIEANPDCLFILKKHPRENFESDYRDSRNEMNRLASYPNVLYLKDQEEIQDLIQISDLWMAFESTSIMESWLLDVPTIMINPDIHFNRVDLFEGSILAKDENELLYAIDKRFKENDLRFFNPEAVVSKRNKIFSNSIGFADGLNHLRVAFYFKEFLDKIQASEQKPYLNSKFLKMYLLLHIGKWFYIPSLFKILPKFKKTVWIFENYKMDKMKSQKPKVYDELDRFYKKNQLNEKISSGSIWKELFE